MLAITTKNLKKLFVVIRSCKLTAWSRRIIHNDQENQAYSRPVQMGAVDTWTERKWTNRQGMVPDEREDTAPVFLLAAPSPARGPERDWSSPASNSGYRTAPAGKAESRNNADTPICGSRSIGFPVYRIWKDYSSGFLFRLKLVLVSRHYVVNCSRPE